MNPLFSFLPTSNNRYKSAVYKDNHTTNKPNISIISVLYCVDYRASHQAVVKRVLSCIKWLKNLHIPNYSHNHQKVTNHYKVMKKSTFQAHI
jgi:hypothetical protein